MTSFADGQMVRVQRKPRAPLLALPKMSFIDYLVFGLGTLFITAVSNGAYQILPRSLLGVILTALTPLALFEIYRTRFRADRLLLQNWPIFLLTLVAGLSFIWAIDPLLSLARISAMLEYTVLVVYGAALLRRDRFIDVLDFALSFGVITSFFLALLVPSIGQSPMIQHHGDSWSGIYPHRAHLAVACSMGMLVWLYQGLVDRSTWRVQAVKAAVGLITLIMANSKTNLLGTLIALSLFGVIWFLQFGRYAGKPISRGIGRSVLIGMLIVSPIAMTVVAPMVPSLVGREDNLSGRTRFWEWGFYVAAERPWLGAGFKSFWLVSDVNTLVTQDTKWAYEARASEESSIGNGHNGYFDTYFELGLVGVAALVILTISVVFRLIKCLDKPPDPILPLVAGMMAYVYTDNVAETIFLKTDALGWAMFLSGYILLSKYLNGQLGNPFTAPDRPKA